MPKLLFDPEFHIYTVDDIVFPSVTRILQSAGLIDFTGIDPVVLQRAADFGTAVHLATCLDDQGDLDESTLDENLRGPLEAWRSFRGNIKFEAIEQPLYSPIYMVAGTPDRIVWNTVIEIKTSSVVPAWAQLQTAAYAILADIPVAKRIVVHLKTNGSYSIIEHKNRKDREVFLCCLALFNWRQNETLLG